MANASSQRSTRAPFPERERIPEQDRGEYDYVFNRVQKLVGGRIEDFPYVGACLNSPPFAASLWRFSGRMLAAGSTGDTFSQKDREHINFVLAFDSGNYTMLFGHFDYAVQVAGIRPEMVKALWEGREEALTDDERQLVDYIRGWVKGAVADEMWAGIVERFGGVRGAVEYTLTLGYNMLCNRSMIAFGVSAYTREEMDEMVRNLRLEDEETRRQLAEGDLLRDPEFLAEMSGG